MCAGNVSTLVDASTSRAICRHHVVAKHILSLALSPWVATRLACTRVHVFVRLIKFFHLSWHARPGRLHAKHASMSHSAAAFILRAIFVYMHTQFSFFSLLPCAHARAICCCCCCRGSEAERATKKNAQMTFTPLAKRFHQQQKQPS